MASTKALRQRQLDDCRTLLKDYKQQSEGSQRRRATKATQSTTAKGPSYATLLSLEWIDSVWQMHDQLRETQPTEGKGIQTAHRYLQLQYKLNTEPRPPIHIGGRPKLDDAALERHLESLLHPYQVPLNLADIQSRLKREYRFEISYDCLLRRCNRLSHPDHVHATLQRFANPYRSQQSVYCSTEFRVRPQLGDKVVELVRMRSRRFGIVVDFKLYRMNGKYYPVIQTATQRCFVDPERIIIVERLEPFEPKPKRSKHHTAAYSLV